MPDSWLTHSARRTPARGHPLAALDARLVLRLADVREHAERLNSSLPELIVITGMPASTAASIDGASAVASGSETTSPSGWSATAWSM